MVGLVAVDGVFGQCALSPCVGTSHTMYVEIYIDDALLTSVNNSHRWRTTQFKTVDYPIPASMLEGKSEVRVRFVAQRGRQVGQIYGVRLKK